VREGCAHDLVVVHDGLKSVSDGYDSDILSELVPERRLYDSVRVVVDRRCSFTNSPFQPDWSLTEKQTTAYLRLE
jgi:hypothetical protein